MNPDLKLQIITRSGLICECGCKRPAVQAEFDHFFGRAKSEETEATVWLLTVECHRAKTDNRPNAALWLLKFITHCGRQALRIRSDSRVTSWVADPAALRAQEKLEWLTARKAGVS